MQMFAFKNTEAGIRRLQQARVPAIDPTQSLQDEIRTLRERIQKLESRPPVEIVHLPKPKPRTTFQRIEDRAQKLFGYSSLEMRADRRHKRVVFARQFVFYWGCRLTLLSTTQIGRLLGGRDHTTVLHGRDVYPRKRAKMGRTLRSVR